MAYYDEFPHTRNYDSDLGFLIAEYHRLKKEVGKLQESYDILIKIYEQIKADIMDITIQQLQEWLDDGTLSDVINETLFKSKADKEHVMICPDFYDGSDLEKIQNAYNISLNFDNAMIYLNRTYDITGGTVQLDPSDWNSKNVIFFGGRILKTNPGYMFNRNAENNYFNAIEFENVSFFGYTTGSVICINGDTSIRQTFRNCRFNYCSIITTINYTQSLRIINCTTESSNADIISSPSNYDLLVDGCKIEANPNTSFLRAVSNNAGTYAINVGRIVNNVIEGYTKSPIIISSCIGLLYQGNYNELNNTGIEFFLSSGIRNIVASIKNNTFFSTTNNNIILASASHNRNRLYINENNAQTRVGQYLFGFNAGSLSNNYAYGGGSVAPDTVVPDPVYALLNQVQWTEQTVSIVGNWTGTITIRYNNVIRIACVIFNVTAVTISSAYLVARLPMNPMSSTVVSMRNNNNGTTTNGIVILNDNRVLTTASNGLVANTSYSGQQTFSF